MTNNFKDWKTTIPGIMIALPTLLQGAGIDHIGHVGSVPGGWLGIIQGIAGLFLGAYATSKGQVEK